MYVRVLDIGPVNVGLHCGLNLCVFMKCYQSMLPYKLFGNPYWPNKLSCTVDSQL